ncbi:MAG: hypothetical protein ACJZ8O_01600 [Pirellulaceae bacterium]
MTASKRLVPELLLKDDDLVRVDSENETNSVRSTAEDGSTKYLSASGKDPKALEELRPVDAATLQPVTIPAGTMKQFWLTLHIPQGCCCRKIHGLNTSIRNEHQVGRYSDRCDGV